MAAILHLQTDEAIDAIRNGARLAVQGALTHEREVLAALATVFQQAYLLKEWFTVDEVAAYVGCDAERAEGRAKAVRKMHNEGLPFVMMGRQRMTARAELEQWLQARPRVNRPGNQSITQPRLSRAGGPDTHAEEESPRAAGRSHGIRDPPRRSRGRSP